jgi:hypothetical protein
MPLSKRHDDEGGNFSAPGYSRRVIAKQATADGFDAARVADQLVAGLGDDDFSLVLVYADWRIDPVTLARTMQRRQRAPVVGCTTIGILASPAGATASAVGLRRGYIRAGIGVAPDLPISAIARSRDAVQAAARALGTTAEKLDPARHVAITVVDGSCGQEEAFCLGSAATAPQIRFVGGSAATEIGSTRRSVVFATGEALTDAGIVVVLETALPFQAVTSSHLEPTSARTVVTAAVGRSVDELDGRPALPRLRELVESLGGKVSETERPRWSFARIVENVPYVRSITGFEGTSIHLASAVEAGHVLRLMRPKDLTTATRSDLDAAAQAVGGRIGALLAFSCIGRHWEAASRGRERELDAVYAQYPTTGFQSYGEHTGMLLVNHTLTALAIGEPHGE